MKLIEIYELAKKEAPKSLSDEYCEKYGAYDNSGIIVDTGEEIDKILFSLDLTNEAVERAVKIGAKLIVTHHPAIYGKISEVSVSDALGKKLIKCIQNGISVISMHLNLDCAKNGIDESLMLAVKKSSGEEIGEETLVMHTLEKGGYGRVYSVLDTTAGELANGLNKELRTDKTIVYGREKRVRRVASFCGSGCDEEGIAFALKTGADAVISADFKHHIILSALERGLTVISLTHYASENYGFKKYYEKISRLTGLPCEYATDSRML